MRTIFLATLFSLISIFSQAQQSITRFPAIDPSGQNIAFSYQGDIWVMNLEDKTPHRITINEAYDSYPVWSPNGQMIAFSSNRYGSEDVFVMNNEGSNLKRLTFHPSNDKVNSWTNPERIVFESRRVHAQIERDNELFYISPNGGNAEKLMDALGSDAIESPDGKNIAFVRGSCRITRQAYQGSANRDIWLYNKKDKSYTQLTTADYNQFKPIWKNNDELLYISSNGGNIYQLTSLKTNTTQSDNNETPISQFKNFGLRYYSYSPQNNSVIMESGNGFFFQNIDKQNTEKLEINISIESRKNNLEHKVYKGEVSAFSLSPNGNYLLSTIHGNIYITQAKDKDNFTKSLTNDSFSNSNPQWLNDSTILFISDKEGQKDIYLLKSDDPKQSNIFRSLKHKIINISNSKEDEKGISISNNREKISYVINYGKLIIANIDKNGKLSNSVILLDSWAEPSSIKWSPDDQFIAYSKTNLDFNQEIYIQAADNSVGPVNVSMHPRADVSPSWSPDGKKLLFSSIRNYGNYDIWYVWLQKKDWEKTMTEWKQEEGENDGDAAKDKKDKKGKKDKTIEVKIDFDHIYQRLYQLTSLPGNESQAIFSKDGKTIYFKSNSNEKGKTDLYKIDWDKKNIKELTKDGKAGNGMILSPDGKYIYMVNKGGKPARLKTANDKIENIAINATADINHQALKEQVYHEAWKTIKDGFYDPKYHHRDWAKLGKMYKPIILNTSTDRDFQDLFNWLLGELNASHMGLRNPRSKNISKDKTALLGIDFTSEKDGLHITKILPESPADKEESKLFIGDIITQFNGTALNKENNLYELLLNKANEPCLLQVKRNGSNNEIIIRPTASLYNQNYADWVEFNRALVDKYSDGKLGYLHIKAMGWASFERFERDLMAAGYGKEGILIDVRYNGGGWTTDYLMAVLTVKQHAYTIPRGASNDLEKDHLNFREYYAFGERLPFASWTKPSIALCNQNSYSNAEIFSHAYKSNHLGTLVGTPTFGAVISTGSRRLSNGGTIRLPFRAWYVKESDMNMELHGAVPDVIVNIKPDSRSKGKDEQLEKAVEILLKQISEDTDK